HHWRGVRNKTESFFTFAKCRLCLSPCGPLPEKGQDGHSLSQNYKNSRQNIAPIGFPEARWLIKNYATRRKIAFLETPALQAAPIKHIGIVAPDNRNIFWLLTVKDPHGQICGDTTVLSPIYQVAPQTSPFKVHIVHDKYRCIGGFNNQRNRLSGI